MTTRQSFGRLPLFFTVTGLLVLAGNLGWQFASPYIRYKQEEWRARRIANELAEQERQASLQQQKVERMRWILTSQEPYKRITLHPYEQSPVLDISGFKSWGFTRHTGGCMDIVFNSRYTEEYCPHKGPAFPCDSEGCRTIQFKARAAEAAFLVYAIFSVVEIPFRNETSEKKMILHPGEALYVNLAYMTTRLYTPVDVEWRLISGTCVTVMLDGPHHAQREICLDGESSGNKEHGLLSELTTKPNSVAGVFFIPFDTDSTIEVRRL